MTISSSPLKIGTIALAICLTASLSGCSKTSSTSTGSAVPAAANSIPAPSKLGDLSPFHLIAADVSTIVDKGDLEAAKARIKDLEVAWDAAEAGLKPRAAADWHIVDNAIDEALSALRTDHPNQADCRKAMDGLLQAMDRMNPTAKPSP